MRRPSNACALVTSCTRCRSMYTRPDATSCASQILSNSVLAISAPSKSSGDDGEEPRLLTVGVLKTMRQVGVERHRVAGLQVVRHVGADKAQTSVGHDRRLAG